MSDEPSSAELHHATTTTKIMRWDLVLTIASLVVTTAVTAMLGLHGARSQETLTRIEEERTSQEATLGEATDVSMRYFAATCAERPDLMAFPLDQWFNWRADTLLRPYVAPNGNHTLYEPESAPPPGVEVAGSVQLPGQVPTKPWNPADHLQKIRDAYDDGYRPLDQLVSATTKEPVVANCLAGRSAATNRAEPEIPSEIISVTELGEARGVQVTVRVAEDRIGQDHVADRNAIYSIRLVREGDAAAPLRVKSISGLSMLPDNTP